VLSRLEREEFVDAARRVAGVDSSDVMTGSAARDWMAAQGG
jgi:hypothetical protein